MKYIYKVELELRNPIDAFEVYKVLMSRIEGASFPADEEGYTWQGTESVALFEENPNE